MYIDNDEFGGWMQKLYAKLEELCKDVGSASPRYASSRKNTVRRKRSESEKPER